MRSSKTLEGASDANRPGPSEDHRPTADRTAKGDVMGQLVAARRLAVGVAAVATMMAVQAPGAAARGGPHGDVRVSPDAQPGAYRRLDGARDATTDACSTRRRQQAEP